MKNYDSEVLYEMYKKKCEALEKVELELHEALYIIKTNNDAGESGIRSRDFLERMGVSTNPEVKFPIPRDDKKIFKKVKEEAINNILSLSRDLLIATEALELWDETGDLRRIESEQRIALAKIRAR